MTIQNTAHLPEDLNEGDYIIDEQHVFLVCTTIIEAGVDIPNANTLIVTDADQLGLAQLYQLRGRVGRMDRRAYAIFLYHDGAALSDIAHERLATLQKYSDLGSGKK